MATPFTNHLTVRFSPAEAFFTGKPSATLVPDVFPVAINGHAYMIDVKSGQYARGFEQRVRDSQDISTAPGESSISTGGLWRRGEASWHLGAGQGRADVADSQAYRFESSKGVDVWTKGELSLLNATKLSLSSTGTNLKVVTTDTRVYVIAGDTIKYTTDPFASSPTWTSIAKGTSAGQLPNATARDMTTDGKNVYLTYPGTSNTYGLWKYTPAGVSSNVAYGHELGYIDFVKGYFMVTGSTGNTNDLYFSPSGNIGTASYEHPVADFVWLGFASGQNAIYAAGKLGSTGAVYKITIKDDGTLNEPIVALDLPDGEYPTGIYGYLGYVLLGTNKGVRYCSTDSAANLVAGSLIPTSGDVLEFIAADRFVYFTYTNYDGISTGLGRLDLANFTSTNTPAYATDLMYGDDTTPVTAAVQGVTVFNNKLVFSVSGVGVVVEDSANLVASGEIVTGTYQWGIPDRKFIAKIDTRSRQLYGTIIPSISFDGGAYSTLSGQIVPLSYESTSNPPQTKFIEARLKFTLNRDSGTVGPTMTRWMARAYAAPARSEVFRVPVLIHSVINRWGADYFFDVENELRELRSLITDPRVVNYQEGTDQYSVIVEEVDFQQYDVVNRDNVYEGTAIITMRSV